MLAGHQNYCTYGQWPVVYKYPIDFFFFSGPIKFFELDFTRKSSIFSEVKNIKITLFSSLSSQDITELNCHSKNQCITARVDAPSRVEVFIFS